MYICCILTAPLKAHQLRSHVQPHWDTMLIPPFQMWSLQNVPDECQKRGFVHCRFFNKNPTSISLLCSCYCFLVQHFPHRSILWDTGTLGDNPNNSCVRDCTGVALTLYCSSLWQAAASNNPCASPAEISTAYCSLAEMYLTDEWWVIIYSCRCGNSLFKGIREANFKQQFNLLFVLQCSLYQCAVPKNIHSPPPHG